MVGFSNIEELVAGVVALHNFPCNLQELPSVEEVLADSSSSFIEQARIDQPLPKDCNPLVHNQMLLSKVSSNS